jgi:L-fucose isomerase-like protein
MRTLEGSSEATSLMPRSATGLRATPPGLLGASGERRLSMGMITPTAGFIVYGVHKDGLEDPLGTPFIDDTLVENSKKALREAGVNLVEHHIVVASKAEARAALKQIKDDDAVDCVILFSGTWVWAAHLVAAVRDFAMTGKGVLIWCHPGSQGWRPVGGLVMTGALKEIGVRHKFVYGEASNAAEVEKIVSFCRAARVKRDLNMSTLGTFGGRGMGQTCGVADPSQWMKMFGVDIDSRDTNELIKTAEAVTDKELRQLEPRIKELFGKAPPQDVVNKRSMRLYLAIKKLVAKNEWDFYTIQSFPGLGDDYCATCFAQSMMLEDGVGTSTLGDFNTALSVILLAKLGAEPVYYGDLQHIDKSNNEIKIIGDGACPPSLAGKLGPAGFAAHGIPTEGEAGGLSVKLVCKVGEGVLARVSRVDGQFQMAVARCSIFEPPAEQIEKRTAECGIPFWPHGFVTAHCDIESLLQNWNNEYAVLGYGEHVYPALEDFCRMTGITPIML